MTIKETVMLPKYENELGSFRTAWLIMSLQQQRAGNVKIVEMVIFTHFASSKWYFKKKKVQNSPLQAYRTDMEILLIHFSYRWLSSSLDS